MRRLEWVVGPKGTWGSEDALGGLYRRCGIVVGNRDQRTYTDDGATPEFWGGSPGIRAHVSRGVGEGVDKRPPACYHRLRDTFAAGCPVVSAVE